MKEDNKKSVKSGDGALPVRQPVDAVTRVLKGAKVFHQDVYKLNVAKRLFNMSWKTYRPNLVEQEHCHFFRSCNDQGIENEYSTAIGGHFHEIKIEWDEDGKLKSAKCGPPLQKTQVVLPGSKRKVTRIMPITFDSETDRGVQTLEDDHTHEIKYLYTDKFTVREREAMRQEESAKVKALLGDQTVKNMTTGKTLTQSDNLIES